MTDTPAVYSADINSLSLVHRGKVRDIYAVGEDHLLFIASDRVSAFDVILPTPVPGKGILLTQIANFWFDRLSALVPNHRAALRLEEVLSDPDELAQARGRSMFVRRLKPVPVEAVVRGYLIGSGWKDYQRDGAVSGVELPRGLQLAERLPEPIYTPSTKASVGEHDENISFAETERRVGPGTAAELKRLSLEIYRQAADYALGRGIIIADTKFEFGFDADDRLVLMDEVFTPDSSRFWPQDQWRSGSNPPSFDKQFVRDYLETLDWGKQPPGPELPAQIIERTLHKYRQAVERLTGMAPAA